MADFCVYWFRLAQDRLKPKPAEPHEHTPEPAPDSLAPDRPVLVVVVIVIVVGLIGLIRAEVQGQRQAEIEVPTAAGCAAPERSRSVGTAVHRTASRRSV